MTGRIASQSANGIGDIGLNRPDTQKMNARVFFVANGCNIVVIGT